MENAMQARAYNAIEWNFDGYESGRLADRERLRPSPHPEDWDITDRDFDEVVAFMRQRQDELDRLVMEMNEHDTQTHCGARP
jgi:hypothetical protein